MCAPLRASMSRSTTSPRSGSRPRSPPSTATWLARWPRIPSAKATGRPRSGRIAPAPAVDALADCDFIVETAIEKEDVKRKILAALCPVLKETAIIGTNTSASISDHPARPRLDRPGRNGFIGVHFMNPVPVMELVEVIRGIATDDATYETTKTFITRLGKKIAVAEDFPAFIVNRILLPMINEAIYTLYEGVGSVDAIDAPP